MGSSREKSMTAEATSSSEGNLRTYETGRWASFYATYSDKLQNPEVMIFVKYKEHVWDKRVLDVGCGAGRTTSFLRRFSEEYTGIDYSKKMVETCKARFPDLRFLHCDVRDMRAFQDGSFDFALFSHSGLDSISHADRLTALKEIYRVLRDDGLFVFSSHNQRCHIAISYPKLRFSWNLVAQLRKIADFGRSYVNHWKNSKRQFVSAEYSILNDQALNYSLMHYYISQQSQAEQLAAHGFDLLEMFGNDGDSLAPDVEDRRSVWIYYVAQKRC